MILIDTSVWIDHFRSPIDQLASLVADEEIVIHPYIVGELAAGSLPNRQAVIDRLLAFPQVDPARIVQFLEFIDGNALAACGLGFVDISLLFAASEFGHRVWAHDKRLEAQARRLDLAYAP